MAQVASELISVTRDEKLADSKYIKDEALENKKQSDINKDSLTGGVYNVTKFHSLQSGYHTITTAIAAIPQTLRCVGMVITYQTASDSWETKQFKGALSDFTDISKWEDFGGGGVNVVSNGETIEIQGRGSEYVSIDIPLIRDVKYRVFIDNLNWDRDNTGSNTGDYMFRVISLCENDINTPLLTVTRANVANIKKYYDITVPSNSLSIRFGGRANTGASISLSLLKLDERLEELTSIKSDIKAINTPITKDNHFFNSSKGFTENTNYYVGPKVRVKEGDTIVLSTPSDIGTGSSAKFAIFYDDESSSYYAMSNNRTIEITKDGEVAMSVRKSDYYDFGFKVNGVVAFTGFDLGANVPLLAERVSAIEESITEGEEQGGEEPTASTSEVYSITGNGTTIVYFTIHLLRGAAYRIQFEDASWGKAVESVASNNHEILGIKSITAYSPAITATSLIIIKKTNGVVNINKSYDFIVPDDSIDIRIGFRAVKDTEVKFTIKYLEQGYDIYSKNKDKLDLLSAATNRNFRLQLLIATDAHEDFVALQNAVDFANECSFIDGIVCLGDNCGQAAPSLNVFQRYNSIINTCTKTALSIPGNHDASNGTAITSCADNLSIYRYITEPSLKFLTSAEVTGQPYFYHDFTAKKVRVICVNDYDAPFEFGTNTYWEAIEYDDSYAEHANGTAYSVGDCVNFPLCESFSFRCISAHTSTTSTVPNIKYTRNYRYIGETQANWIVNAMLTTPANYGIVICTHVPASTPIKFSNTTYYRESKFCSNFRTETGSTFIGQENDIFATLANAFKNGENGSINVRVPDGGLSDLRRLNVNTENGVTYAYKLNYDFSSKNTGTKFLCFLSGHSHVDYVLKDVYGTYNIVATFTDATTRQQTPASTSDQRQKATVNDCPRSTDNKSIARDALTAVAFDVVQEAIILTRVGTTATTDGYKRDVDRVDLTQ